MKLTKINLNQLDNADLNEREMCRLLGGGTPGCCQCGCHYTATTASNDSANNSSGYTSDPDAQPCDCSTPKTIPDPPQHVCTWNCNPQSTTCIGKADRSCG